MAGQHVSAPMLCTQDANEVETEKVLVGAIHNHRMTDKMRRKLNKHDMQSVTADAGVNVFGCIFLEVWALNKNKTRLVRVDGGVWIDPAFRSSLPDELRLEADNLVKEAPDTALGVGLPGTIFAEKNSQRIVQWRQLKSIMTDPFKQRDPSERTVNIFSLGIGLVGSTTFSNGADNGIILFYTRSSKSFDKRFFNEDIILQYTDFIGITFAMIQTREECRNIRQQMRTDAIRKVRAGLLKKYSGMGVSLEKLGDAILSKEEMTKLKASLELASEEAEPNQQSVVCQWINRLKKISHDICTMVLIRVKNSPQKWSGVNLHGPPRNTLSSSTTCFIWVFLAMLMILKMSTSISPDSAIAFDGTWYSSTLCILFALTPAPVGQPRQIIAAHWWNMIIGILLQFVPTGNFVDFPSWGDTDVSGFGMPIIWKEALAVAIGVSGQAYLGILHPPATALSIAFATNERWSWVRIIVVLNHCVLYLLTHFFFRQGTMVAVLVTDVVLIILSVLMINLSEQGQYPLWWMGFSWNSEHVTNVVTKRTVSLKGRAVPKFINRVKNDYLHDEDPV